MSTPAISGLAGLVHGFTTERDRITKEDLDRRISQRDSMVQYLGHLASNPNIPPEHQQWALAKVQELIQHDLTKKLPKVDLTELPPAQVPGYTRQQTTQAPGMTLTPPAGPGGQPTPAPSSDVGRASDSTVNALGALQQPLPPAGYSGPMPVANVRTGAPGPANAPGTVVGGTDQHGRPTLVPDPATQPNFAVAPQSSSLTLPAGPATTIQNPVPPVPISAQGQLHVLTPQDKEAYASAAQGAEIERLRQQYPDKSQEDLAYFAKHGEFPKDEFTLTSGEKRYKNGKVVAENTAPKPGQKTGYSYERGPGGGVLVKDNATGATLSQQEIAGNPAAKAVYDTGRKEFEEAQAREDERDEKKAENARRLADEAFERAAQKKAMDVATKGGKDAKAMVDVLDTSEKYMASGEFSPREDLALIVRAVRAMNPGTVRLPQKELELELARGTYGDNFRRWWDSRVTTGLLPDDQRNDLMNVIRHETTQTATSAANNWREAFKGTREEDPPTYLRRFETKPGDASIAPEGAEHEVYVDGKLVGHTVGGKYVPLGKGK